MRNRLKFIVVLILVIAVCPNIVQAKCDVSDSCSGCSTATEKSTCLQHLPDQSSNSSTTNCSSYTTKKNCNNTSTCVWKNNACKKPTCSSLSKTNCQRITKCTYDSDNKKCSVKANSCESITTKTTCQSNSLCKWSSSQKCYSKQCVYRSTKEKCIDSKDNDSKSCSWNTSLSSCETKAYARNQAGKATKNEGSYENFNDLKMTYAECGDLDRIPVKVPAFTNSVFTLVKVFIPIILIVLGMIDFARAVVSGQEDRMNEATKRFVRRIVAGLLVFFVLAFTQFLVKVADPDEKNDMLTCMKCFIVDDKNCDSYTLGGTIN